MKTSLCWRSLKLTRMLFCHACLCACFLLVLVAWCVPLCSLSRCAQILRLGGGLPGTKDHDGAPSGRRSMLQYCGGCCAVIVLVIRKCLHPQQNLCTHSKPNAQTPCQTASCPITSHHPPPPIRHLASDGRFPTTQPRARRCSHNTQFSHVSVLVQLVTTTIVCE